MIAIEVRRKHQIRIDNYSLIQKCPLYYVVSFEINLYLKAADTARSGCNGYSLRTSSSFLSIINSTRMQKIHF